MTGCSFYFPLLFIFCFLSAVSDAIINSEDWAVLSRLGKLPHSGSESGLGRATGEGRASDPNGSCLTVPLLPHSSRMFYVDTSCEGLPGCRPLILPSVSLLLKPFLPPLPSTHWGRPTQNNQGTVPWVLKILQFVDSRPCGGWIEMGRSWFL